MLFFPNAKINLGLNIVGKRSDGFHNIETVFIPVGITDILEFVEVPDMPPGHCSLAITGALIEGNMNDNLIVRAYRLMHQRFHLPAVQIHLHKIIPMGAGLGGGSSDASFMIKHLNIRFNLKLTDPELCDYASQLGSDCPFFISNKPVFAWERGNIFKEIDFIIPHLQILVVHPGIHVSTAAAYAGVKPQAPAHPIQEWITRPVAEWKGKIVNDFETTVFQQHPLLGILKNEMYNLGSVYASMSGSGSAIYGLFNGPVPETRIFEKYYTWQGTLTTG
jgi:4-diphosphocytidyl-2-C-methyl-D-erythritol kinase